MRNLCIVIVTIVVCVDARGYDPDDKVGDVNVTPSGGGGASFPLDAEGSYIDNLSYVNSNAADPADSGVIRCGNNESCVAAEAATPGTDVTIKLNASDLWEVSAGLQLPNTTEIDSPALGQIRFGTGGVGAVLDFNDAADTLNLRDYAGTGALDIGIQQTGRLYFTGTTGDDYCTAAGAARIDCYVNGTGVFRLTSAGVSWFGATNTHDRAAGAETVYYRSGNHGDDAVLHTFKYNGKNSSAAQHEYGAVTRTAAEDDAGDEDGRVRFYLTDDGTERTLYLDLDATDGVEKVVLGKPLQVPSYTLHVDIDAGSTILGPTAPSIVTQGTSIYLGFDADAETIGLTREIPDCWTADADIDLRICWTPESGDAIADGETVIFRCEYRMINWGSETDDNNTSVVASFTYTQSGAGTDRETQLSTITIDYDNVNQPIAIGDTFTAVCNRDVTSDTYSGSMLYSRAELVMSCDAIPNH